MSERSSALKRGLFPILALVPLIAATVWWISENPSTSSVTINSDTVLPPAQEVSSNQPAVPSEPAGYADKTTAVPHQTPTSLGENPFAQSLAGTEIDGSLKADQNGNLIVDLSTKDFFDYFLNTVGEVSPETALAEIEALARNHLPAEAADRALAILDQYLDYKQQALAMGNQTIDPVRQQDPAYQLEVLKSALSDLKQLRRNAFAPDTHQAFFGLEEAYGDYTLASIEIRQRGDLSEQGKQTLIEWHRQQLPEQIRKTETEMIEQAETSRQRQAAIAGANSPEQAGERLRALGMEPQQVTEVVGYLQEREQFDERFQNYQQELASLQSAGISNDDTKARQDRLLEQHFDSEQARTWARLRLLGAQSN